MKIRPHPTLAGLCAAALILGACGAPAKAAGALTDARRWALAMGAILPVRNHEGLDRVTLRISPEFARMQAEDDWDVHNHDDAIRQLRLLRDVGLTPGFRKLEWLIGRMPPARLEAVRRELTRRRNAAALRRLDLVKTFGPRLKKNGLIVYDESRRSYLARTCVTAGLISSAEAWTEVQDAARILHDCCGSWRQLGDEFLIGRRFLFPLANQRPTSETIRWLEHDPVSPWRAWNW